MLKLTKHGMLSPFGNSSMHKRKYPDEAIAKMKELKNLGKTFEEIGKVFGVSRGTIYSTLRRHSQLDVGNSSVPEDYVTIGRYMEEYGETYSGVYWHISKGSLPSVKIRNKIYVPLNTKIKRRGISEEQIDKILAADDSLSLREIGRRVGCHYLTVKAYKELLC